MATPRGPAADGVTDVRFEDRGVLVTIRSVVFTFAFYLSFAIIAVFGLPALAMPRRASLAVIRLWARVSVALLHVICGTRLEFRNLDLLPKGASILAVKHQSFLETFALITVLDDFSYVLKKELAALPFFGWYVRATGQISVDRARRGGAIAKLQAAVRARLAAGRQVVIFPEGTRKPVGAPPDYKVGVAALCANTGVPCTPVALNTGLFWPRTSFRRQPGKVVIEFLPPIATGLPKCEFMGALESAIEKATDALVSETVARRSCGPAAGDGAARALRV